jgi:PGF-CTERM protein
MTSPEYTKEIKPKPPTRRAGARPFAVLAVIAALTGLAAGGAVMTASAQSACTAPGMNAQCTSFGEIWMPSKRDINGESVVITTEITIYRSFEEHETRWIMFSMRNNTADGRNPVTVELREFSTPHGDIITSREEHKSNQVNLWVDILDLPVGTPITMTARVGSTDRGAFLFETLVMAFDRGYAPIMDEHGNQASLFSFTLLGVSKASSSGFIGSIPGFSFLAAIAAAGAAAGLARRRYG